MVQSLNVVERRVLGSLLEKSMAQPDYYPMTLKAVVAACNQKHNRDPILSLDEDAVWDALESLREHGLVTVLLPGAGARTKRFRHEVESHFGWQRRERTVMTELLLRGPQTAGELRSRCSRFMPFDDLEAVTIVLDCLAQYDPPMVTPLSRQPGKSTIRYTHTLYPEDEKPISAEGDADQAPAHRPPTLQGPSASADAASLSQLQSEVENLQEEVAELHEGLSDLRKRLESIESQLL